MINLQQATEIVKREFPQTTEFSECHLDESFIEYVIEYDNAFAFVYSETSRFKNSKLPGFWCPPQPIVDKKSCQMIVAQYPYELDFKFVGEGKRINVAVV